MQHVRVSEHDRFVDIRKRIGTECPVIVDGGANQGRIIDSFLAEYNAPLIHAFEPIPSLFKALRAKYYSNKKVIIHGNALGAKKYLSPFNIVNNIVSSSFLKPTPISQSYHGRRMDIKERIYVQQVRLDEVLNGIDIDILKLDLQGYELEALKGCKKLIDRIKIITTEIEFIPLYEEQPLFGDIDLFLRRNGFRLLNLYELYTQSDGQLTAGDAVYLNTRVF
jgi:FkbM family methyltransferase